MKGFAPVWLIPRRLAPIAPESVETDAAAVAVPILLIKPVWFCAPESVIGAVVPVGLRLIVPVPVIAPPMVSVAVAVFVLLSTRMVAAVEPDAKETAWLSVKLPVVQVIFAVPAPDAMVMGLPRVETLVPPPLLVLSVAPGVIVINPVPK